MSPNNGILLNGVLKLKLLNNPFASCSFINLDFLLLHTAHFDNNIDLPFLFSKTFQPTFCVFFLLFKQYVNMFYNDRYTNNLGLTLFQAIFLLVFCFKYGDLSHLQLAHLDFSLIALFGIFTFCEPISFVCFSQLKQQVYMFHIDGNSFFSK